MSARAELPIGRCGIIQRVVAREFRVSLDDLLSQRRDLKTARPRMVAMYLARKLTPYSLPRIGEQFGGRDHSTVLHAIKDVEKLMGQDAVFTSRVRLIETHLSDSGAMVLEESVTAMAGGLDGQFRQLLAKAIEKDPVAAATAVFAALKSVAAAAFLLLAAAAPARAQEAADCGPTAQVMEALARKYGERPVASGLNQHGLLITILRRDDSSTWTIIGTAPQGYSCVLEAGEGWHELPVEKGDPS